MESHKVILALILLNNNIFSFSTSNFSPEHLQSMRPPAQGPSLAREPSRCKVKATKKKTGPHKPPLPRGSKSKSSDGFRHSNIKNTQIQNKSKSSDGFKKLNNTPLRKPRNSSAVAKLKFKQPLKHPNGTQVQNYTIKNKSRTLVLEFASPKPLRPKKPAKNVDRRAERLQKMFADFQKQGGVDYKGIEEGKVERKEKKENGKGSNLEFATFKRKSPKKNQNIPIQGKSGKFRQGLPKGLAGLASRRRQEKFVREMPKTQKELDEEQAIKEAMAGMMIEFDPNDDFSIGVTQVLSHDYDVGKLGFEDADKHNDVNGNWVNFNPGGNAFSLNLLQHVQCRAYAAEPSCTTPTMPKMPSIPVPDMPLPGVPELPNLRKCQPSADSVARIRSKAAQFAAQTQCKVPSQEDAPDDVDFDEALQAFEQYDEEDMFVEQNDSEDSAEIVDFEEALKDFHEYNQDEDDESENGSIDFDKALEDFNQFNHEDGNVEAEGVDFDKALDNFNQFNHEEGDAGNEEVDFNKALDEFNQFNQDEDNVDEEVDFDKALDEFNKINQEERDAPEESIRDEIGLDGDMGDKEYRSAMAEDDVHIECTGPYEHSDAKHTEIQETWSGPYENEQMQDEDDQDQMEMPTENIKRVERKKKPFVYRESKSKFLNASKRIISSRDSNFYSTRDLSTVYSSDEDDDGFFAPFRKFVRRLSCDAFDCVEQDDFDDLEREYSSSDDSFGYTHRREVKTIAPTALYAAIGTKNWNAAICRLLEVPEEASTWVSTSSNTDEEEIKFLPLHIACLSDAPLMLFTMLVQVYPDSVRMEAMGKLPIHMACDTPTDHRVVFLLLNNYPESLHLKDDEENTPVEVSSLTDACEQRTKIIQVLTSKMENTVVTAENPTALYSAIDCQNWNYAMRRLVEMPQEATTWVSFNKKKVEVRFLPLHAACLLGAPLLLVEDLVQSYPEAVKKKTSQGKLPLHIACEALVDHRVVTLLLNMWPDALIMKDNEGKTPVDVLRKSDVCPEKANIEDVLNERISNPQGKIVFAPTEIYTLITAQDWDSAIRRLLEAPEEASTWVGINQKKRDIKSLPLHAGCSSKAPLLLVAMLIQTYPDAIKLKNSDGKMPIHLVSFYIFIEGAS